MRQSSDDDGSLESKISNNTYITACLDDLHAGKTTIGQKKLQPKNES